MVRRHFGIATVAGLSSIVLAASRGGGETVQSSAGFYDFNDYERLVAAAKANDRNAYLVVLLGGEAGLRCGEIMALE